MCASVIYSYGWSEAISEAILRSAARYWHTASYPGKKWRMPVSVLTLSALQKCKIDFCFRDAWGCALRHCVCSDFAPDMFVRILLAVLDRISHNEQVGNNTCCGVNWISKSSQTVAMISSRAQQASRY